MYGPLCCHQLQPTVAMWTSRHSVASVLCLPRPQEAGDTELPVKFYLFFSSTSGQTKHIHWLNMGIGFVTLSLELVLEGHTVSWHCSVELIWPTAGIDLLFTCQCQMSILEKYSVLMAVFQDLNFPKLS